MYPLEQTGTSDMILSELIREYQTDSLNTYISKLKALGQERSSLDKSEENGRLNFSNSYSYLQKKAKSVEIAFSTVDKIEPLSKAIDRHSKHKNFNDEIQKQLETYYSSITNKYEPYNKNEAYKEYFKTIYKTRNTIQGSSVYRWRKLNKEEVSKLVNLYNSYKE